MSDYDAPLPDAHLRDHDAEQILLGSLMRNPEIADDIADVFLPDDDYAQPANAVIHAAIVAMQAEGKPTENPLQLHRHLVAAGQPAKVADPLRLAEMWERGFPAQARYYAAHLARLAEQRRLRLAAGTIDRLANGADFDTDEALETARAELDKVARATTGSLPPTIADLLPDAVERIHEPPPAEAGIATGLPDLDVVYPGHVAGRVTVVGARPGVGKSTLGMQFARHAAITCKAPTLFVSMEMTRDEIMDRIVSAESGVLLRRITRSAEAGELTESEKQRIDAAIPRIHDAPLYIDDTPHVSLGYVRHKARSISRRTPLGLIVLDYLQLMETPRSENRQQAVSALSRGLKLLAKDLAVPIVVLAQLNRASTTRTGGRPALADLRESGSVEQDADAVLLLHRQELIDPDTIRAGQCDVLVVKNRHGPTRDLVIGWEGEYARCVDVTRLPPLSSVTRLAG